METTHSQLASMAQGWREQDETTRLSGHLGQADCLSGHQMVDIYSSIRPAFGKEWKTYVMPSIVIAFSPKWASAPLMSSRNSPFWIMFAKRTRSWGWERANDQEAFKSLVPSAICFFIKLLVLLLINYMCLKWHISTERGTSDIFRTMTNKWFYLYYETLLGCALDCSQCGGNTIIKL